MPASVAAAGDPGAGDDTGDVECAVERHVERTRREAGGRGTGEAQAAEREASAGEGDGQRSAAGRGVERAADLHAGDRCPGAAEVDRTVEHRCGHTVGDAEAEHRTRRRRQPVLPPGACTRPGSAGVPLPRPGCGRHARGLSVRTSSPASSSRPRRSLRCRRIRTTETVAWPAALPSQAGRVAVPTTPSEPRSWPATREVVSGRSSRRSTRRRASSSGWPRDSLRTRPSAGPSGLRSACPTPLRWRRARSRCRRSRPSRRRRSRRRPPWRS